MLSHRWLMLLAIVLLGGAPTQAKPTGLSAASICCGSSCHKLHEEDEPYIAAESLVGGQIFAVETAAA
jgi:hypothetical protein